jgi:hypothetical protein
MAQACDVFAARPAAVIEMLVWLPTAFRLAVAVTPEPPSGLRVTVASPFWAKATALAARSRLALARTATDRKTQCIELFLFRLMR